MNYFIILEPVYDLFISKDKKARFTNCKLVFNFLSVFFRKRLHFSNHAKELSTTHLLGITLKVCNSLLFAISTVALKVFSRHRQKIVPYNAISHKEPLNNGGKLHYFFKAQFLEKTLKTAKKTAVCGDFNQIHGVNPNFGYTDLSDQLANIFL